MKHVLVTGASGHLGFTLTQHLINHGYTVRAGVRGAGDAEKVRYLVALGAEVVETDLERPATLRAAAAGVDGVFHVAAVFRRWAPDPQNDIVKPTVRGALDMMRAAHDAGVKKVVYTSSSVAVGEEAPSGNVLTEADWNGATSSPYPQAKVLAEREVWAYAKQHGLNVVSINPVAILGPNFRRYTPTTRVVGDMVDGSLPVIPDMSLVLVDVRDVAEAHRLAYENDKAEGRYLVGHDGYTHFRDLAELVKRADPSAKAPSRSLPKQVEGFAFSALAFGDWLSYRLRGTPRHITEDARAMLGNHYRVSSAKAERDLGWKARPLEETVRDTVAWIRTQRPASE